MKLYKFIKEAALQKQALNMYNGTGAAIGGALGGTAGWYGSDFFTKDKTIKTIAAILGALGLGYAGYKGGNKLNNQIKRSKIKQFQRIKKRKQNQTKSVDIGKYVDQINSNSKQNIFSDEVDAALRNSHSDLDRAIRAAAVNNMSRRTFYRGQKWSPNQLDAERRSWAPALAKMIYFGEGIDNPKVKALSDKILQLGRENFKQYRDTGKRSWLPGKELQPYIPKQILPKDPNQRKLLLDNLRNSIMQNKKDTWSSSIG